MADHLTQAVEADPSRMNASQVLDRLIEVRTALARLGAVDDALLDRLDELAEAGEVDQGGFNHNDWGFSWSAGRRGWTYPANVKALEAQVKAAKKAAEGDGSAVATTGAPYWTIREPKA